jgi:hypothetical protein
MQELTRAQAVGRTRGSISAQSISLLRHRTESASVINRIRSDSNRTQSMMQTELADDAEFINHAIESQGTVAQLPPVMVWLKKIVPSYDDHGADVL